MAALPALAFLALTSLASAQAIDHARARLYFAEAHSVCSRDAGKLWGVSLCGPMMFVDPKTRALVANQPDANGQLQRDGDLWSGNFPKEFNIANTSVVWSGTRWTQLRWPVGGSDVTSRQALLLHEMFHRVQEQLHFATASPSNAHLDSAQGRVLLRAEMRALRQALLTNGSARKQAARDALTFRAMRRVVAPEADKEETALELNEGLCEYTGIRLSRPDSRKQALAAADALHAADSSDSYVRSFAYSTGPAYGLLLDALHPTWRKEILAHSQGLEKALAATLRFSFNASSVPISDYGLASIRAEEDARRRKQEARLADAKARFVDGPTLVIPLHKAQVQFDPNTLYPFGSNGTVYPEIRIADDWGILTVKNGGALLAPDWSKVTVAASGEGWDLELKPGWSKKPGLRAGDLTIVRE
ncbi:MAG TPA: hypothetical protein VM009_00010 [Terriglobales bacterium]|nr:hypothetical protein [Terriglobales bacterium]